MENLIFTKIPIIMGKVGAIGKDRTNTIQGYKFRGIDDMYNALNTHLAEEKIFFTSEVLSQSREERSTKNGGMLMYSIITMKFTAYAEDGSNVSSVTVGEAMDSGDKSMNKAMSTAYKYALMQIFCIPTEEEKDTEVHTHEVVPIQQYKTQENEPEEWFNDSNLEKLANTDITFTSADDAVTRVRKKYKVSKQSANAIRHFFLTGEIRKISTFPKT